MSEIPRIGGEAKLVSIGPTSLFITTAPVRGFEKMIEGKSPSFVIQAVMRICGICHASHAIASCEAFEHAFGIYPPRNGLIMREAIGLLNRIQSHLLHNIMILPDILNDYSDALSITIKMLEIVNKLLTTHAGAPTHPNKIVIGGVAKEVNENLIERSKEDIAKLRALMEELGKIEMDEGKWSKMAREAKNMEVSNKFLATHLFYGDRYAIKTDLVKVIPYGEIHEEEEAKKSSSMVATYNDNFVEVGPRARLKIYKNFDFNGFVEKIRMNKEMAM